MGRPSKCAALVPRPGACRAAPRPWQREGARARVVGTRAPRPSPYGAAPRQPRQPPRALPRAGARRARRTVHAAVAPDARERLRPAARPRRATVQPRLVVRVGQHRGVQRRQHLRRAAPSFPRLGLLPACMRSTWDALVAGHVLGRGLAQ